ncbi:hypothetical protein ACLB2K_047714 [Fragaria x ananassa]
MCILLPWDGYLLYLKISELLCCILLVIIPWLSFQISWRMNVSEKTGTCLPYHPSSPSSKSDYLVMAVNRWKRLAFCRPGGDGWTIVNEEHGQYYIVDAEGQVWVCDIDDPKQARKRALNGHPIPVKPENFNQGQFYYLMESGGVLLTVQCTTKNYERRYFRVFEVPFDNGDWLDSEVHVLHSLLKPPHTLDARPIASTSINLYMDVATSVFLLWKTEKSIKTWPNTLVP